VIPRFPSEDLGGCLLKASLYQPDYCSSQLRGCEDVTGHVVGCERTQQRSLQREKQEVDGELVMVDNLSTGPPTVPADFTGE